MASLDRIDSDPLDIDDEMRVLATVEQNWPYSENMSEEDRRQREIRVENLKEALRSHLEKTEYWKRRELINPLYPTGKYRTSAEALSTKKSYTEESEKILGKIKEQIQSEQQQSTNTAAVKPRTDQGS